MKKSKKILVTVSALALRYAVPSAAMAQVSISCPVAVNMGQLVACDTEGLYRLRPSGGTDIQTGCFGIQSKAMVGQCILKNGGIPVTKSVKVTITDNNVPGINGGGNQIRYNRWRINTAGTNGKNIKTLTFSSAEVNATVTINIATRIRLNGNNAVGSYVGSNIVRATEIP